VPDQSAKRDGYGSAPLHGDHKSIVRFNGPNDAGYTRVASQLAVWAELVATASQRVAQNKQLTSQPVETTEGLEVAFGLDEQEQQRRWQQGEYAVELPAQQSSTEPSRNNNVGHCDSWQGHSLQRDEQRTQSSMNDVVSGWRDRQRREETEDDREDETRQSNSQKSPEQGWQHKVYSGKVDTRGGPVIMGDQFASGNIHFSFGR
jgi:hypothetical protein